MNPSSEVRASSRSSQVQRRSDPSFESTPAASQSLTQGLQVVELWTRWRDEAPCGAGEQRGIAVERLYDCVQRGVPELDLSELDLSALPERLPEHIRYLDVSRNVLRALPTLPDGLRRLDASNNRLTNLREPLPGALRHLNIDGNDLAELPASWPDDLHTLRVSDNRLDALPETLPEGLRELFASHNQLTALPEPLPARLDHLVISHNQLTRLPATLPAFLRCLSVACNQLTHLPQVLPSGLVELFAESNQLTALPESLLSINPGCYVQVEDNPLSHAVLRRLREFFETQGEQPTITIRCAALEARQEVAVRPLSQIVAQWLPDDTAASGLQTWTGIEAESHAAAFAAFLQRLTDTRGARESPDFHDRVLQWLTQLAESPRLREQTFVLAQDATASCEDRVALTYNAMQVAALLHRVEDGQFDRRLPALLAAGREMFRLDALESIARAKAATLRLVDEIEVYLAYQTGLGKSLELSTAGDTMRYEDLSGVTPEDLERALADVQARESRDLADWLAAWAPWRKAIERVAPECFDKVERDYNEAMDVDFQRRVSEELSARQLADCPDAEAAIGKVVTDAFRKQRDDALTRAFLLDQFVVRTSGGTPLTHLDRIEELVEIAVTAPAIAAMAISVRDRDGQHIGSRIADSVTLGGASALADAYLSTLRMLFIDGRLDTDVVIDLLLPRRHDDGPKSIAHAVAGAAWRSQAALTLCLLLGEIAATADGAHRKVLGRMSLPHANYAFDNPAQPQRADFLKRAKHADRNTSHPAAVAHLLGHALVPADRELHDQPSNDPTAPIAPDRDQRSLLNRINDEIRPLLSVALIDAAVARSQRVVARAASRRDAA